LQEEFVRKRLQEHIIEASLEFSLHPRHSNFDFLNGVESTNHAIFSIPMVKISNITYIKHLVKGILSTKVWNLMIWLFD
jgi:hypothetical protein